MCLRLCVYVSVRVACEYACAGACGVHVLCVFMCMFTGMGGLNTAANPRKKRRSLSKHTQAEMHKCCVSTEYLWEDVGDRDMSPHPPPPPLSLSQCLLPVLLTHTHILHLSV